MCIYPTVRVYTLVRHVILISWVLCKLYFHKMPARFYSICVQNIKGHVVLFDKNYNKIFLLTSKCIKIPVNNHSGLANIYGLFTITGLRII